MSMDTSDQEMQKNNKSKGLLKSVRTFKQLFKMIKEEDEKSDSDS